MGKVALLSVVLAVYGGNRRPGQTLLSVVPAVQLLMAAWVMVSLRGADFVPRGEGGVLIIVAMISFVLAVCLGINAARPEGLWATRTGTPWKNWTALGLIAYGIWNPLMSANPWTGFLFSPTGALPHGTLLVMTTLAWLSAPNGPRLASWALGIGALILGGVDVLNGVNASVPLLAAAALLGMDLLRSTGEAGGVLEDDEPPVERERRVSVRRRVTEESSAPKRWKLK